MCVKNISCLCMGPEAWRCGCLVAWFCYEMIAKPSNKTALPPWPDSMHMIQYCYKWWFAALTHRGRVTHICVSKLIIIGSDNGLSPDRRQAIIWTNSGILLIGPVGTNFSEILIEILTFSFKKMRLKVSSVKRRPFCLGLNELSHKSRSMASGECH